jgi:hypothetical protein
MKNLEVERACVEGHSWVERYKLNPVDPQLESTRFQPSNLSSDILVSKPLLSNSTCTCYSWDKTLEHIEFMIFRGENVRKVGALRCVAL